MLLLEHWSIHPWYYVCLDYRNSVILFPKGAFIDFLLTLRLNYPGNKFEFWATWLAENCFRLGLYLDSVIQSLIIVPFRNENIEVYLRQRFILFKSNDYNQNRLLTCPHEVSPQFGHLPTGWCWHGVGQTWAKCTTINQRNVKSNIQYVDFKWYLGIVQSA